MKKTILILFTFTQCLLLTQATEKEGETRTAKVTYEVSANDVINIQAKNTNLKVEAWEKNEVMIEATIRFDGRMTDKMQKFLDSFEEEVKNNISDAPGELLIKTNLDEPNKFQLGSKHVGIIITFDEDDLKLEYNVKMPASNSLIIKNSYRDLVLTGRFKEVEIDQYSGDLEAEYIENADIRLKYGSAYFEEIEKAKMVLYEQDLTANFIGELDINTKYSELKIKELGKTEIQSYESDFEIGTLTYLEGNLKYGQLEITQRFEEGKLTTYEFDIEAKSIGTLLYIGSKYGNLEAESIEKLSLDQSYEDEFDLDFVEYLTSKNTKYGEYKIGKIDKTLEIAGYEDDIFISDVGANASNMDIQGKYLGITMDMGDRAFKLTADTKYGSIDFDHESTKTTKYIKDGDQLEIEVTSSSDSSNPLLITIKGYEIKLRFD